LRKQGQREHTGRGILTLPSGAIGEKFLSIYPGLYVQGRHISFQRNNTQNQHFIEQVRATPWEDPEVLQNENRRIAAASAAIPVQALSFGRLCRDRSFSAEIKSLGSVEVVCDISARQVQFRIEEEEESPFHWIFTSLNMGDLNSARTTTVRFLSSRIIALSATPKAGERHHVFLESLSPPLFERTTTTMMDLLSISGREPIPQRLPSLDGQKTMPPVSRCVCVAFSNRRNLETFLARCRMLHLPRPVELDTPIERRNIYSENNLKQLADFLRTLSLGLAYEVQKVIAAAILDPLEFLTSLKDPVLQLQHEHAAAIFRRFVGNLDAPSFAGKRRRGNALSGDLRSPEPQGLAELLHQSAARHYDELSRPRGLFSPSPATFQSYQLVVTPSTRILEGPLPDRGNG
jgi:RNA-dependent RNA polymerase